MSKWYMFWDWFDALDMHLYGWLFIVGVLFLWGIGYFGYKLAESRQKEIAEEELSEWRKKEAGTRIILYDKDLFMEQKIQRLIQLFRRDYD